MLGLRRRERAAEDRAAYYDRVVEYLGLEFRWSEETRLVALDHLKRVDGPLPTFEFILDEYVSAAAFRLKWDDDGLRVAYFPTIPPGNSAREAWARKLTADIRAL